MFSRILIANRGEIACRVIRTARRMAIHAVAVYSEADVEALHVEMADEAILIGPPPARDSYLRIDRIIEAARRSGAEAVHPGYGFLSEKAEFAEACAAAGLVFIGPPPSAIRAMGSKSESKALMQRAGVPVVPGYHGEDQGDARLAQAAEETGYPVLLKASAGGGGKGMRRVDSPADFSTELAGARRESLAAFGDDRMLIEKYLLRPRHIEVQVFGDGNGAIVHLFERDCSIQRRHQKVVEEAPAPGLADDRGRALGETAIAAARAIGYVGAGTVEFIADQTGAFYFMEMNTRLQVEHPVTELITGQDLVEWQIRVAAGEPLPLSQAAIHVQGHAIEARLYAEDPDRDFLPSTGRLAHVRFPPEGSHVRVDAGVRTGDTVSIHYDPMLAKVVVWDRDRASAVRRIREALAGVQIVGVTTNHGFLSRLAQHEAYAAGELDTGFIQRHAASLLPAPWELPKDALAATVIDLVLRRAEAADGAAATSGDPHSPWHRTDGWRLNLPAHDILRFHADRDLEVTVRYEGSAVSLEVGTDRMIASGQRLENGDVHVYLDGRRFAATVVWQQRTATVIIAGSVLRLERIDLRAAGEGAAAAPGRLTAPMPGRVVAVPVKIGQSVRRGETLMVLEAMKMEHAIVAPVDGAVEACHFGVGDLVEDGTELLSLTSPQAKQS